MVEIAKLGLALLRNAMAIIPQVTFLPHVMMAPFFGCCDSLISTVIPVSVRLPSSKAFLLLLFL